MKLLSVIFQVGVSMWICVHADATPTSQSFGINGATTVFDCPWNAAHTECTWDRFAGYNGTTIHTATGVTTSDQGAGGYAWGTGELSSTSYLPTLHAFAASDPAYSGTADMQYGGSARATADVWAVQGYRYTGSDDFLLTITATLDATILRPDMSGNYNFAGFQLSIFDPAGYVFGYGNLDDGVPPEVCPIFFPQGIRFCPGMPTVYAFDHGELADSGTVTRTVDYLLHPGAEFYVGAAVSAVSCCGETVDASHTLSMRFNDASLLVSRPVAGAAVSVPEPGALILLAIGSAACFAGRRSRRVARPVGA